MRTGCFDGVSPKDSGFLHFRHFEATRYFRHLSDIGTGGDDRRSRSSSPAILPPEHPGRGACRLSLLPPLRRRFFARCWNVGWPTHVRSASRPRACWTAGYTTAGPVFGRASGNRRLKSPRRGSIPRGGFLHPDNSSLCVYHPASLTLRLGLLRLGSRMARWGRGFTWQRCNAAKPWFESTVGPPSEDSSTAERRGTTPETLVRPQLLAPISNRASPQRRVAVP